VGTGNGDDQDEVEVPPYGYYTELPAELPATEPGKTPGITISTRLFYTFLAGAVADGLHITLPTPLSRTLARMLLEELDGETHGGNYPPTEE
jgi:hypothetical protein